jgi:hypothetical protein
MNSFFSNFLWFLEHPKFEPLFYLPMFGFSQNGHHTKGVTTKCGKILAKYKT